MLEKSTFFCFGPPKSGTTLLQRCLNLHPMVSCPSEHHLDFLFERFDLLFQEYNRGLDVTDQRTGGQGATHIPTASIRNIFRASVLEIIDHSAQDKPIAGINDNSLFTCLPLFKQLFPQAKFIAIFRHPIPRAISAWNYNLLLAQDEQDPKHAQLLDQYGKYEDWILLLADQFNLSVAHYQFAFANDPNAMAIKYEDLVSDKTNVLQRLFQFLNTSEDPAIIQNIVAATEFEVMRAKARRPHFFRAASSSADDDSVSHELQLQVRKLTERSLSFLGYD